MSNYELISKNIFNLDSMCALIGYSMKQCVSNIKRAPEGLWAVSASRWGGGSFGTIYYTQKEMCALLKRAKMIWIMGDLSNTK